ncbi:hypothetical protein GCM10022226_51030 [Sphaerisporangium flaviroseum]|uniref:Secreted protein n=2 Tax=Sphaerisporangium flaviroseum TaxID=509199 RepID=A0ABP7IQY2_9ACTN
MVRSLKAWTVVAVVAIFAAVGLNTAPAYADSVSYFDISGPSGYTMGSITWHDYRSVTLQGKMCDHLGYGSTARFDFYLANEVYYDKETRTADYECIPFHWTQQGPKGGIQQVNIRVCEVGGACGSTSIFYRWLGE